MAAPRARFDLKTAHRVAKATQWVEQQPKANETAGYGTARPGAAGFWAKITSSAAVSGNPNRWRYAWTEQRPTVDGWDDLPSGRTGTTSSKFALNSIEANNPDTDDMMGNSVDTDATSTTLSPVQGDPVVWMWEVSAWDSDSSTWKQGFRFTYENTVDCAS
jgi:hypothetical protein